MDYYNFFCNNGVDFQGRTLDFILNKDNFWWDSNHDHIQVVFPVLEPGMIMDVSPITMKEIDKIKSVPNRFEEGYFRFLSFLGLRKDFTHWDKGQEKHYTDFNHNYLRFSRVIRSLRLFGYDTHAEEFYNFIMDNCKVFTNSVVYWTSAAKDLIHKYIGSNCQIDNSTRD